MSALANVPGLAGYLEAQQQNEARSTGELQKAAMIQGLLAHMQQQAQAQKVQQAIASSGGDVEKAAAAAMQAGDYQAAAHLTPLAKQASERRQAEELRRAITELNAPQPAASAPQQQNPMVPGPGASVMAGSGPVAPQQAPAAPLLDPAQARIAHLKKLETLYATNPIVAQRIQAEIEKVTKDAEKPPQKRERIEGENLVQEEYVGGKWKEVGRGPRFARQVAPVINVKPGVTEAAAGLSEQYGKDPTYKKNVDYWANFLKDGGTLPPRFAQSGAGKKMMPDILNVVPTLGASGRDLLANQVELTGQKAEARSVGTRAAAVEMAAGEAREMMPILLKTSENFQRTGYQPINSVFKAFQDKTGNVESRQFGAALNSFVNVYARAVSPSGVPTVSDKDHAREVLSTADSHEQLVGLLKVLDQEMTAAQTAPQRVREAQRSSITGRPAPSHGTAAPTPLKNAKGWNLMIDAKGNKAYVGPNREIEEVR